MIHKTESDGEKVSVITSANLVQNVIKDRLDTNDKQCTQICDSSQRTKRHKTM